MASKITVSEQIELEEEQEGDEIEVWDDWQSDEEDHSLDYKCLFCDTRFSSADLLFDHCGSRHSFDFYSIVKDAGLDFYGSFKLINYVRSQVASNTCWCCGLTFQCTTDLQSHLHEATSYVRDGKFLWGDDLYLKPHMEDDALLHSFAPDTDEEDYNAIGDKEELMRDLVISEDIEHLDEICEDSQTILDISISEPCIEDKTGHFEKIMSNRGIIKNVNENYFGAYSSFGIHREMISDKVRTDAYRKALLDNRFLLNQSIVMDVGCGTGILSLFAAQAGATRVIAVEASAKMASVATQIAKENGLLFEEGQKGGVINVVQGMVEEINKSIQIPPRSIDVLISEWMGYCLLYESMLSSVLYARDHWLKPGGAILPDTASIFVAGFGKGGTSLPFWENVYGFDMSCIGKEVVEDAARVPIVDVLDSQDILTESVVLKSFDLVTMKPEEMDFTTTCFLELKPDLPADSTSANSGISLCYGIILWFETGFTRRFCKENPLVLSTSPYSPRTHWSQTILTFREPVAMTTANRVFNSYASVGSEQFPAAKISARISIARSSTHRSIDISVETTGVSFDGRRRSWTPQIFKL